MDKTNLFFWIVIILLIFISLGRIVVIRIKANPDASEEKKRKVDLIYNIVWCILYYVVFSIHDYYCRSGNSGDDNENYYI